jgi:hypothetical protein
MTGHAALVAMAEREVALARAGLWEDLAAAMQERVRAAAALEVPPPASARSALERLKSLHDEVVAQLELGRVATAHELRHVGRGRATVRGYSHATPALRDATGGRVDAGA